jgi:glycosyltransferase involved in cell wall biosynthesis
VKILIAVHHFPPRYTGGAEWRAFRTASALNKRGHQAEVVAVERIDQGPDRGVAWEDDEFDGIKVRRISYDLQSAPDPFLWEYDNPWLGDHLTEMLQDRQPDIFHLIGGYLMSGRAILSAREARVPCVVTLTDFWFLCRRISMMRSDGSVSTLPIDPLTCARCLAEEKRRYRLPARVLPGLMDLFWQAQSPRAKPVEDRLNFLLGVLNQADTIISPSEFLKSIYVQSGVDADRIIFSRQGRDFPELNPEMLKKEPSEKLRIGYLGQIAWLKGVHVLVEAATRLTAFPVDIRIYGDQSHFPDYANMLRSKATRDPRLIFEGSYQRGELSKVLRDLDVLVVPSLWYENSPNVILEAFAHKTPVVASDLGGMAELVLHEKNGLLFETGNPGSLAAQLRRLHENRDLLVELRAGIEPVRTVAEEIDELEDVYSRISFQTESKEIPAL